MLTAVAHDGSGIPAPFLSGGSIPVSPALPSRTGAEQELVAQLQQGDQTGYERLVREYGGAMLAIARRLLRNEDDAQEVVQDAFLQVFRAIGHFRKEARLCTWLHRIVVNASLMRLRTTSRRPEGAIDDLLPHFDEQGCHAEPIQPLPANVEMLLASAETSARVRACVAQLPEAYRAVMVLRELEELSNCETAQVLGISENAVKIRLHRARQALRALLVRELGERPID